MHTCWALSMSHFPNRSKVFHQKSGIQYMSPDLQKIILYSPELYCDSSGEPLHDPSVEYSFVMVNSSPRSFALAFPDIDPLWLNVFFFESLIVCPFATEIMNLSLTVTLDCAMVLLITLNQTMPITIEFLSTFSSLSSFVPHSYIVTRICFNNLTNQFLRNI